MQQPQIDTFDEIDDVDDDELVLALVPEVILNELDADEFVGSIFKRMYFIRINSNKSNVVIL